ncbi:MAG: putative porin [Nitrospinota bacterium]|nr:putative porin [Nitrospinota bacterium]
MKKILAGIIVLAVALTGLPVTSFAGVQVGDNLKLFGDFRMRFEFDDRGGSFTGDDDSRERPRLRLRFGGKYQSSIDNVAFGFRLATGTNSINSPHDTFQTAVTTDNTNFGLDRAFATVKFLESGIIIVGKQGYPLWQQTEVMWDEDIQPEGFAAAYTASLGGAGSLTAAAAYYYLVNNSWESGLFDNDTFTAWQVAHKGTFNGIKTVIAATGLHGSDGADAGVFTPTGSTNTEASPDPAFYMVSGQVNFKFDQLKIRVGGDYHFSDWNETGDDHDTGYVVHGRVNMDKWGVRYYYYDIEEASVPFYGNATLSQDNFPNSRGGGLTGFEGHRIQLDYKLAKDVSSDFRIYLQEGKSDNRFSSLAESADREINRYQLNINVKF